MICEYKMGGERKISASGMGLTSWPYKIAQVPSSKLSE